MCIRDSTKDIPDDAVDAVEDPLGADLLHDRELPPAHVPLLPPMEPLRPLSEVVPPEADVVVERIVPIAPRHFHHGVAGDGVIYINDANKLVKLDKGVRSTLPCRT